MSMVVAVDTRDLTREQWLEHRRKGLGGSDAAAVAGLSPWKSPVDVWLEKTGQAEPEELGEAAYWGTVLEDVVAREFSLRTGLKVRRRNAILRHPQFEWMIANVDRLLVGENVGLECKTANAYSAKEWEGNEVPAPYILQVQHYMAVTGAKAWWMAVLIGGQKFIYKRIERDDELIQQLIKIERDFWENHVVPGIPPELDGSPASTELVKRMYPRATLPKIDLPSQAKELIEELEIVKSELKVIEERKDEIENKLKQMLGEHEEGRIGNTVVLWKNIESKRIDTNRLKKEKPDIYEQYLKISNYRKFDVRKAKEA